jgi:eukaryotic-like serine/threonine-protein kinase
MMTLAAGVRLGAYEILSAIGAGGMGEVYRARDTRLKRDVALKTLPESFASDPERLARFQREAEVLGSLNHPHIAAIYGLEHAAGVRALVLELVEGETLADRISRGPVPRAEALAIAKQIAEALDAAHGQGIIHRDLKPANIKVTPDGVVKVLDFGLAKLVEGPAKAGPYAPPNVGAGFSGPDTMSPTITSPAMMTGIGVLLGTAAYMSPEQAKGREADKRSDIWAFGCVLYEMLTGRRAFDGEDMAEVLGAVVLLEPNWQALPSDAPPPVRALLQRCLVKDRRTRIADIAAARFVLDHQADVAATSTAPAAPLPHRRWRRVAALTASALTLAVLAGALVWFVMRPAPARVERFTITPSVGSAVYIGGVDRTLTITPDGMRVIYVGNSGTQLFVRMLDQLEPRTIAAGIGLRGVFVSPDGQSVGFVEVGAVLKTVAITGGPTASVVQLDGPSRGATWAPDDTIVFATSSPATGLQRVSAAGGEPTVLTKPDSERGERDHWWPESIPGGDAVLFTIAPATGSPESGQIAVLDLRTGASKVLIRGGSHAYYVPTGHLVYGVAGTMRAVAFDLGRLEIVGTSVPVLEGVVTTLFGAADAAVAANGTLVYVPGAAAEAGQQTVVSVDRQGRASPLPGFPLDSYRDVRVSPDGARLAVATLADVWTYDFSRATLSRLTTHSATDTAPLWTPDGQRIVFTSRRAGYPELFSRAADGTGSDERFLARGRDLTDLRANGWSADGRELLFTEVAATNMVGQIALERPSDVKVLVKSDSPSPVSPDGHWLAYQSNVSGRPEIYVERYPELGSRQQISTDSGTRPLWSRDGRELFFTSLDGRQMFVVPIQSGGTLVAGRPQVLFELAMLPPTTGNRPYDVAPDGRFMIIRSGQADGGGGTAPQIVVVKNWFEELKRLVPVT